VNFNCPFGVCPGHLCVSAVMVPPVPARRSPLRGEARNAEALLAATCSGDRHGLNIWKLLGGKVPSRAGNALPGSPHYRGR